ncbi:hypothetical protein HNP24_000171 [Chryseobacterium sediminis]|uniref:Uncharacterized protein n=1 Tax=Chryseobacterium sediminis TaxID=1679494 RepID=A0ABR6PUN4_9FLAO|nr:hypothetical protein [Chryseobacterium sediminis]MBB6329221.1 hypothetical protein [Chryseobacterium sediminis]
MEIKEIKEIKLNNQNINLPNDYWLNIKEGLIEKEINIIIEDNAFQVMIESNNFKQICNKEDLIALLDKLNLKNIDFEKFRLKSVITKKWGEKIIYDEGARSICFACYCFGDKNIIYLMFLNTDGTKEIENLYIHGIWRIKL